MSDHKAPPATDCVTAAQNDLTPARRWVNVWKSAGIELERIRERELRDVDTTEALALLMGHADYTVAPFAPSPDSGLVDQQRWFARAARCV